MSAQRRGRKFDEWTKAVFDRPADTLEFFEDDEENSLLSPADAAISFITRLFNEPEGLMTTFSREQVAKGLWFLANDTIGYDGQPFLSSRVTDDARRQCVMAVGSLFARLFAKHCSDEMGHLQRKDGDPLNSPCYMWFDLIWYHNQEEPGLVRLAEPMFATLEGILALPSNPCRESALHGLGHLRGLYPERVAGIVDSFLDGTSGLPEALKEYAIKARAGEVL